MKMIMKTCCFCLPLKTGMMVLGILSLIAGIGYSIAAGTRVTSAELKGYWSGILAIGIATAVFSVIFLVGHFMSKPGLLKPFYFWLMVKIPASIGLTIWAIVRLVQVEGTQVLVTAAVIVMLIGVPVNIYYIFAIKTYIILEKKRKVAAAVAATTEEQHI